MPEVNVVAVGGAVLAALSFALVLTARAQLGRSFAVTPQAKELVTHGLYSRIQHPMYVFVDLTIAGLALALGRWVVAIPLAILMPLQFRNAWRERKVLAAKFGDQYEQYRRRTWV